MNIILIAHEKKKELLLRFCETYNSVLKKHSLFSTEDLRLKIISVVNCSVSAFLAGDRGATNKWSLELHAMRLIL